MSSAVLANACRYAAKRGPITIATCSDGRFARLDITDSGSGLPEAAVDQASHAGERYRVSPGLKYDTTARIGIAPRGSHFC